MSRKLLIVNQYAKSLTVEIANAFVRSGKYGKVVIATGENINPKFGLSENVSIQPIARYNMRSTFTRMISWIRATVKLIFLCVFKYREYELFLISNPPIDSFVPNFCRNKYSTLIFDVYPDGLGNFASKKSLIYRLWAKNNVKFYKNAQYVYTLTNSMAETIAQYCPIEKIEVVSLWATPTLPVVSVGRKDNPFIKEHPELADKFIIMYSGNIGLDHDLTCLLDAVKSIDNPNICAVIIGEGYNKLALQNKAKEIGIESNCLFYPFQTFEMLPYSLTSADLSVVATKPNGRSSSIPSKVFDLMKLGQPILCLADPLSEISLLVNKHDIGKSFTTTQIDEISGFIKEAYDNPELLQFYRNNSKESSKLYTSKLAEKYVK
ncbi:MAG: glycosyltransferase family 4 protein [Bacteroidales bacterium]|nr:glycosyltransferase family 4 protein [Bacteroidales bacterium]